MCAAWLGRTVGLRNAERATPSDGTYQLAVCNVLDPLPKLGHDAIAVPTRRHGRARKALVAVVGVRTRRDVGPARHGGQGALVAEGPAVQHLEVGSEHVLGELEEDVERRGRIRPREPALAHAACSREE